MRTRRFVTLCALFGALIASGVSAPADEPKPVPINTSLSSTVVSGYVNTTLGSRPAPSAPPSTGIRGQTFAQEYGFFFQVSRDNWLGDDDILAYPTATSFTVLSAVSHRPVEHFTTASDGSFKVSLPPGKYVVVPDALSDLTAWPSSFDVTVRLRHYTDITISYEPTVISVLL